MNIPINQVASVVAAELEKTILRDESIIVFFEKHMSLLKDVVLFGGAIRDIFLFGMLKDSSDLDFVVRCDRETLGKVLSTFNPKENKFGGFRFFYGRRGIDIWALEDTWAIKHGYVANRNNVVMQDLLKTTFFHIDSVYFPVRNRKIICSKSFINEIVNKQLKINLINNPSPSGIVKRIKIMREEKGMEIDERLRKYINEEEFRHNCS